jgi:hypothetical protein
MGIGFVSRGLKQPESGVDHPTLSSAEVKEREELYLRSTQFSIGEFYTYMPGSGLYTEL